MTLLRISHILRPSRRQDGFLLYEVTLSLMLLATIAAAIFTSMSASTTLAHRSITLEIVNNYLDNVIASMKSNEVGLNGALITPGLEFTPSWSTTATGTKIIISGGPNGKFIIPATVYTKCVMDSQVAGIAVYRYSVDCVYSIDLPGSSSSAKPLPYTTSRQILRAVQLPSWDSSKGYTSPSPGTPNL